jgi:hypothetical protein
VAGGLVASKFIPSGDTPYLSDVHGIGFAAAAQVTTWRWKEKYRFDIDSRENYTKLHPSKFHLRYKVTLQLAISITMATRPCTSNRAYQRCGGCRYHHDNTSLTQPYQNVNNLFSNFTIQPGGRIQGLLHTLPNSVNYFGALDVPRYQSPGRSDISPLYPAWRASFSEWNDAMPDIGSNYAFPGSPSHEPLIAIAEFSPQVEFSTPKDSMLDSGSPQSAPSGTIALEPMQLDYSESDQMLSSDMLISDPYSTAYPDISCVDPFGISGQSQQIHHMGLWDFAFDNINQPCQDTARLERTSPEPSPILIFDQSKNIQG